MPLIIDSVKLLEVISDASIKWDFVKRAGRIYARSFYHFGLSDE